MTHLDTVGFRKLAIRERIPCDGSPARFPIGSLELFPQGLVVLCRPFRSGHRVPIHEGERPVRSWADQDES